MHSAEHILTAVMQRHFLSPCNLEMHLDSKKSKCDYAVPGPLSESDLAAIEKAVNGEIEKDQPVSSKILARELADQRFDLSRVPAGIEEIRVVCMGDLNETPCSGEHVEKTGEIGRFRIRSSTMKTDQVVRIRFALEDRSP